MAHKFLGKENQKRIGLAAIAGIVSSFIINKTITLNQELVTIMVIAYFIILGTEATIKIFTKNAEVKANARKNSTLLIFLAIITLIKLGPNTELFALPFLALPAAGAVTSVVGALGATGLAGTVGAVLLGLPALIIGGTLLAITILFGGSLSTILGTISNNFIIILGISAGLIFFNIVLGKK